MQFDANKPVNEIGQLVVELHQYGYQPSNFILIKDEGGDYTFLDQERAGNSFWQDDVIATICSARAPHTVRGGLLLHGKKVKPQAYLRHWRTVTPIPISGLKNHGLAIHAKLSLNLHAERAGKFTYCVRDQDMTLKTFDEFEGRYGSRLVPNEATGKHEAEFDLEDEATSLDLQHFMMNRAYKSGDGYFSGIEFKLISLSHQFAGAPQCGSGSIQTATPAFEQTLLHFF